MATFTQLTSRVVVLPINNIDTDQIIPARFLKGTSRNGLGVQLFADWRYTSDGAPRPDFVLNQPTAQGVHILLAGDNFGCGSSREHAPWALWDWGFRAVISTSFADIFRNNALKNGVLPLVVDSATHEKLLALCSRDPAVELTVDLHSQSLLLPGGRAVNFPINDFSKYCLLQGIDELGYLLSFQTQIDAYEAHRT